MSYWEQGEGEKSLLLLHGSNQSLETFSLQFASPLLSEYHVIALDLPGHGQSSPLANPSMLEMSSIISEFVRLKMTRPFIIVGFSLGGHIALGLMANGIKPIGLALLATPPAAKPINMHEMFQVSGPMGLLYKDTLTTEEVTTLAQAFYRCVDTVAQEVADIKAVAASFKQKFPATLMNGEHIDEQEFVKTIKIPVLVATAQFDTFVQNQQILMHLPRLALHKNYSAGHNLHRESAKDFNADLAAFASNVF
jgi:pimeloyl-ACP methyl ester carboxylesterase